LVPRWQAMQLLAALGYARLALLFRIHDVPLLSDSTVDTQLISRQVRLIAGSQCQTHLIIYVYCVFEKLQLCVHT